MPSESRTSTRRAIAAAILVLGLLGGVLASGCAEAPYRTSTTAPGAEEPDAPARASLWERITEDGYADWRVAPGYQVPRDSGSHHGPRVQIFLNDTAATARQEARAAWPDGSIIVADFLDDHAIVRVAAMEKRAGAWYFAVWTPDGRPLPADDQGDPCTDCHSRGTDGTLGVRIGR